MLSMRMQWCSPPPECSYRPITKYLFRKTQYYLQHEDEYWIEDCLRRMCILYWQETTNFQYSRALALRSCVSLADSSLQILNMVNWSSLRPLKVHLTFMTIVILVLVSILVLTPRHAFRKEVAVSPNKKAASSVNAINGLLIRNAPNISGIVLRTAPYRSLLTIIDGDAASDVINGKAGHWFKVEYDGIIGFAWGNHISN